MASNPVIEHFDVVEHIRLGQVAGFVDPLSDAFLFQTTCRVPDDQMSYRSYPLLAAKELLQQFIREQGYGHQAT